MPLFVSNPFSATYIVLPGVFVKSFTPETDIEFVFILLALKFLTYTSFQRLVALPKLYVFVASGIMSLAISPLNVIVSVSASPNIISPSALIFPVA